MAWIPIHFKKIQNAALKGHIFSWFRILCLSPCHLCNQGAGYPRVENNHNSANMTDRSHLFDRFIMEAYRWVRLKKYRMKRGSLSLVVQWIIRACYIIVKIVYPSYFQIFAYRYNSQDGILVSGGTQLDV